MFDVKEMRKMAAIYKNPFYSQRIYFSLVAHKSNPDFGGEMKHFYLAFNVPA